MVRSELFMGWVRCGVVERSARVGATRDEHTRAAGGIAESIPADDTVS
jgi:hypothetical protein